MGSVYESPHSNIKSKDFEFFSTKGNYTDDSIQTIATADWLLHGGEAARYYSTYGLKYRPPMGDGATSEPISQRHYAAPDTSRGESGRFFFRIQKKTQKRTVALTTQLTG